MINVTKTFFPPIEEYNHHLERIWENQWLTNRGKLVLELEKKLEAYLNVSNIIIMNNGTIPIQIALKINMFPSFELIEKKDYTPAKIEYKNSIN